MPTNPPDPVEILDDLAEAVGDILADKQIPRDPLGATFASLNLLHLAATIALAQDLPPQTMGHLTEFFQAACRHDEAAMVVLHDQLLGERGARLGPTDPTLS